MSVVASSPVEGMFHLTFEGKETANITHDESRESFKYKLEALGTIHVASVRFPLSTFPLSTFPPLCDSYIMIIFYSLFFHRWSASW